jgi:hypothetical protein
MTKETNQLVLTVGVGSCDDNQGLAILGRQLRTELLELDVEAVNPAGSGAAPKGAKGDPVTLAALAVTLAPIALTGLIKAMQDWVTRHDRATVTVESGDDKITITGSPSNEQRSTIEAFIRRHQS